MRSKPSNSYPQWATSLSKQNGSENPETYSRNLGKLVACFDAIVLPFDFMS